MNDEEFIKELGKILDEHYSKLLLPYCPMPDEIIEFLKRS